MESTNKGPLTSSTRPQKCVQHVFHFVTEAPSQGLQPDQRHAIRSHVMKRHRLKQRHLEEINLSQGREVRAIPIHSRQPSGQLLARGATDSRAASEGRSLAEVASIESIIDQRASDLEQETPVRGLKDVPVHPDNAPETSSSQTHFNTTPPAVLRHNPAPYSPGAYCIMCGAPQSAWEKRNPLQEDGGNSLAVQGRRTSSSSELSGILGAGRVDPFQTSPIKTNSKIQELMDHTLTYLLPGLVPDPSNSEAHPVSKAWLKAGLENPLLFHALAFAGSIHLDLVRWAKIYPNSTVALPHKLSVMRHLKEALGDLKNACKDEVILAILILASHETMEVKEERRTPFNSPLRSAQWLNVYSAVKYVPEHMKAVMELVTHKGGLEKIELVGLVDTILAGDVVAASNAISRPALPLLPRFEVWVDRAVTWATSPPRPPVQKLADGFAILEWYGVDAIARSIFTSMGALTMAIDHYLQGKPAGLTLGAIAKIRMGVQHSLLSMRETVEVAEVPDTGITSGFNVYEACRLSALIYSYAVIFPVANSHSIFQTLVQRLQASLSSSGIEGMGPEVRNLYLWMLVLGGIAALDKPERIWFVSQLKRNIELWRIYDWKSVEEVLETFLWLDSACGLGGKLLWFEVMNKHLYLETFG